MVKKRTRDELITKMKTKGNGLRNCINMHCIDCIYDPLVAESWREQIHNCTAVDCGLYPVRQLSTAKRGD